MEINKRYCKVIFEKLDEEGNTEDYREFENSLNVKFTYQRFLGNGMHSKGKISICGLTQQAIDLYTSFLSQDVEVTKRKTLKVIAGYEDENKGIGTILSGSIITAVPTLPPDVWLNCEVINQYEAKLQMNNYSFKGTKTLKEVIDWVATEIGLNKVENRISNNTTYMNTEYKDFVFEGNKFDLVGRIGAMFYDKLAKQNIQDKYNGISTYIEDNSLIVDYQDLMVKDYDRWGTPKIASKDSEELKLVGLPQPMWAGQAVTITTLLNPSVKTGEVIELKNNLIKALNGYYYVFNITYNGEFRGTQWYSQFLCRRLQ